MRSLRCHPLNWLWVIALAAQPALHAADAPLPREFAGATPLQWSVRLAKAEMDRRGNSLAWTSGGKAKWDYTAGLFTLSLLKLNEVVPDPRFVAFATNTIGSFITPDGKIQGYKVEDHNIDNLNPGKTALALYRLTQEERYQKAALLLRQQLTTQPRTREGGFWHKQRYPNQMWLDGLYMGAPFYVECALRSAQPTAFDDVARQFRLIAAHTYDPASGLYYHGWDESKQQDWANPTTGCSSNFWGRAIGWYAMALVDVLDFYPTNHAARPELIAQLRQVAAGVIRHQDPTTGLWYQVVDQSRRKGNYLEATASAMFTYTLAKGLNRGYLSRDFQPALLKGYAGLIGKLVKTDAAGKVSLTQCCSVAGLGYGRSGSYDYYLSEPVIDNDLKGVGPFILAGIELQQQLGLPGTTSAPPQPAAAQRRPTLFLIGDSTVNNGTKGLQGWGTALPAFFDAEKVSVENRARGGRSSRTFFTEGLWSNVLAQLRPGDFLLMQFGHNDGGGLKDPKNRASIKGNGDEIAEVTDRKPDAKETVHSYGWYLRQYISGAKAKGATPIVLSLVPRNIWKDGKVARAGSDYGRWAAEAAQAGGAAFIDLNELVARRYEDAGPEKVKSVYFLEDHTHTTPAGARLNAETVVEGIRGLGDCALKGWILPTVPR